MITILSVVRTTMPPKPKKNAPPATPKREMHKSRSKPQPPPEIQSTEDLVSMDESSSMTEFRQMLGNLTAALMTMSILILPRQGFAGGYHISSPPWRPSCQHSLGLALGATPRLPPQRWHSYQPSLRLGPGGTATASASANSDMEQSLRNMVEH